MNARAAELMRERFGDPTLLALEAAGLRYASQPLPGGRIEHHMQRRDRLTAAVVAHDAAIAGAA